MKERKEGRKDRLKKNGGGIGRKENRLEKERVDQKGVLKGKKDGFEKGRKD